MQKIHFFNFFQKFQYLFIKIQHLQMYHKYKSHVDYITIKDRLIYSRDLFVFIIILTTITTTKTNNPIVLFHK